MSPRHILVAVGWPYASGSLHLGHLGGAYLPPDIFARYHRAGGQPGAHGVRLRRPRHTRSRCTADQDGTTPQEVVDRYHPEILGYWESLGISFDLFTTTMTENHREVTWDVFRTLRDHGYIAPETSIQFYDPEAERFLPDRYVEGTCPHCGYDPARGDQCDNCGRTLDPDQLIGPRSRLTGATPVPRETEHYFLLLPKLADPLLDWLKSRRGLAQARPEHGDRVRRGGARSTGRSPATSTGGYRSRPRRTRSGRASGSTSGSRR